MVVLDDHTRYSAVKVLQTKGQIAQALLDILKNWETQTGYKLKKLRTDDGTEFRGVLTAALKERGADHQLSTIYTPAQN